MLMKQCSSLDMTAALEQQAWLKKLRLHCMSQNLNSSSWLPISSFRGWGRRAAGCCRMSGAELWQATQTQALTGNHWHTHRQAQLLILEFWVLPCADSEVQMLHWNCSKASVSDSDSDSRLPDSLAGTALTPWVPSLAASNNDPYENKNISTM
jgi:hypothetical protein